MKEINDYFYHVRNKYVFVNSFEGKTRLESEAEFDYNAKCYEFKTIQDIEKLLNNDIRRIKLNKLRIY